MHDLSTLKPGDSVEIIAPASRCSDKQLAAIKELVESWQLNCIISADIFGDDLLCANSDEIRFNSLKNALQNPTTKAIICARGGYGSMRLIPQLTQITPTTSPKLFVGMSDITALNLYLQQQWQWPTIHSAPAIDKFSPESIAKLKSFLFGEVSQIEFQAVALNKPAEETFTIDASITGGNLCLAQTSIGTKWQINGDNKIIFLEEIGERGYRVDRMLEHLRQAHVFENAAAILFGDFIEGNEPNGSSLISPVLKRFAQNSKIPVIQVQGIGHGYTNHPIPLGTKTQLQLGDDIRVVCFR